MSAESGQAAATAGTVRDALGAATDALAGAGIERPSFDAGLLLAEALGVDRGRLTADPEAGVPAPAARRFGAMVRRRVAREPIAYILGRRWFRDIELEVSGRVLIPRPETELLVEVAVELAPASVCDVGTGSGAVALAVAAELPGARVLATDISPAALAVARANAARLELADRVGFEVGTLPDDADLDLVVANLPYVSESEWDALEPEITRYEPREALVAGPSGLEAIAALLARVAAARRVGAIALEVGAGQSEPVAEMLGAAGYASVAVRPDLAGIDRVVVGQPS